MSDIADAENLVKQHPKNFHDDFLWGDGPMGAAIGRKPATSPSLAQHWLN
jgi:hypothetical protein